MYYIHQQDAKVMFHMLNNYLSGDHMRHFKVLWISMMLRQWSFAVLLLSIPLPVQAKPTHALSSRLRRTVSPVQLMHDKGRYQQERKRQLWLQELLKQVHTANGWDISSNIDAGLQVVSWGANSPKPASSTKDVPLDFALENNNPEDTLPQETNKERPPQAGTKRKKRVCLGKWRDSNKRRGWPCSLQSQMTFRGQ